MSSAASLMAAVCISASLASKFENATTINSPHIARVESTYRRATCSPNNNAETAAAANSQKNFLRRRLCILILFWRLIEPTPFVCFDDALMCGASGFVTVKHTYHLHFPISQLLSSHQCLGSDHSFSQVLTNLSLSVHLPASSGWAIAKGLSSANMLLSIHAVFSWAIKRCVSKSSVGASTAVRATESAQRAVRAHVS